MSFHVRKLTSRIGAIVEGLDTTVAPTADTVTELRRLLDVHKALVFDAVDVDDRAHERIAGWFGPLTTAHPTIAAPDGGNVSPVDSETSKANRWHSDVTFIVNPPQITTLRSLVTTPYGGETLIANAAAAYDQLPAPLRRLADELWAVHTNQYDYAQPAPRTAHQRQYDQTLVSTVYETVHPVVRIHPLTGERGLFIGGFARQILGLSTSESEALLRIFQSYITRPENVVRWNWSPHQLLIFDNRITQHYAIDNYDDLPRLLHRVTVAGEVPTGADGDRSRSLTGDASDYTPLVEAGIAAA